MIIFPKAKINLGLRITAKRQDGYHDIETIFYPVSLSDVLEFVLPEEPLEKDNLTITGIFTGTDSEENIVIKAVRKVREKYSLPILKIHLHKSIPAGAGLGGGSSDAASLLIAINKYYGPFMDEKGLKSLALEIGSDCPFFIDSKPSFARGKGELLEPIRPLLSGYYLCLLNPGVTINTREAYQNCRPVLPDTSLLDLINHPISDWKNLILNDFEDYAFKKYPVISSIKKELYNSGALFSLMSGSGSSVYGIFDENPELMGKLKDLIIYQGVM